MTRPLISIILPVYNGSLYLREAITSILTQDVSDIELIAINDASSDDSDSVLKKFTDKRIVHITNTQNIGLASTLNLGITLAKGKYIARMDQDDIADPRRLGFQTRAFHLDSALGVCGSNFQTFGSNGSYKSDYPLNHDEIFTNLLFYNCIAHPTVMFKNSIFKEHSLEYDKGFDWAEDLELWTRARYLTKFSNLGDPLLKYRSNIGSMTASGEIKVHKTVSLINKRSLSELGINASDEDLDLHLKIGHHLIDPFDRLLTKKTEDHLWKIIVSNMTSKIYAEAALKQTISTFWHRLLLSMPASSRQEMLNTQLSEFLNSANAIKWTVRSSHLKGLLKKMVGK